MLIRTRYLALYRNGVRLGRRFFRCRLGWGRGGAVGLGLVWRPDPIGELVLSFGPWAASVSPGPVYLGPMGEILEQTP